MLALRSVSLVNREIKLKVFTSGDYPVHIVASAKIEKVVGSHGGAIKIALQAPAVEGKANTALRRFLAEKLSIPQRAIVLERGERSRHTVISRR